MIPEESSALQGALVWFRRDLRDYDHAALHAALGAHHAVHCGCCTGERYFANRLLDYDLAANNGGWQWCASTGCDAQPWFRIFNPVTQSQRFDPEGGYIRRWIPELARVPDAGVHAPWEMTPIEQHAAGCVIGRDYPAPVVRHAAARQRTLARYQAVKAP